MSVVFIGSGVRRAASPLAAAPTHARRTTTTLRAIWLFGAENGGELLRDGGIELRIRARPGVAIGAPPHELGGVAEAVALEVVVGDLDHALGPERLP